MARSVEKSGPLGGKVIEHYNDAGQRVGLSEVKTDVLGGGYAQHYDESGEKAGYTERVGHYLQHYDANGDRAGYSEGDTVFLGDKYIQHFDTGRQRIGYSEAEAGEGVVAAVHHGAADDARVRFMGAAALALRAPEGQARPRPAESLQAGGASRGGGTLAFIAGGLVGFLIALWNMRYVRAALLIALAFGIQLAAFAALFTTQNNLTLAAVAAGVGSVLLYFLAHSSLHWGARTRGGPMQGWGVAVTLAALSLAGNVMLAVNSPETLTRNVQMVAADAQRPVRQAQAPAPVELRAAAEAAPDAQDGEAEAAEPPPEAADAAAPPPALAKQAAPPAPRGWIGVTVEAVEKDIAFVLGLPEDRGALVTSVAPGSPAAAIGMRSRDVILAVNGREITSAGQVTQRIRAMRPAQQASLEVYRGGAIVTVSVRVDAEPGAARTQAASAPAAPAMPRGSTLVSSLGVGVRPTGMGGLEIVWLRAPSALADQGIAVGDVIEAAGGAAISTPAQLAAHAEGARRAVQPLPLVVRGQGYRRVVTVGVGG